MEQGKPLSATDSPLVDFDAVCQKVRAAIEPRACMPYPFTTKKAT